MNDFKIYLSPPNKTELFDIFDVNRDGTISIDEFIRTIIVNYYSNM
jgi:Ca2+-binding EF-hand superfamily protein